MDTFEGKQLIHSKTKPSCPHCNADPYYVWIEADGVYALIRCVQCYWSGYWTVVGKEDP